MAEKEKPSLALLPLRPSVVRQETNRLVQYSMSPLHDDLRNYRKDTFDVFVKSNRFFTHALLTKIDLLKGRKDGRNDRNGYDFELGVLTTAAGLIAQSALSGDPIPEVKVVDLDAYDLFRAHLIPDSEKVTEEEVTAGLDRFAEQFCSDAPWFRLALQEFQHMPSPDSYISNRFFMTGAATLYYPVEQAWKRTKLEEISKYN